MGYPPQPLPPRLGLNYQVTSDINLSTCLDQWAYLNHCDVLRDLLAFVQFKKCEKHPWGVFVSVKLQGFSCVTKNSTPLWVFFVFFKLHKWYRIAQRITILNITFQELMQVFIR